MSFLDVLFLCYAYDMAHAWISTQTWKGVFDWILLFRSVKSTLAQKDQVQIGQTSTFLTICIFCDVHVNHNH